jgi:predicted nuclease of predicted toxin-antitoxin system
MYILCDTCSVLMLIRIAPDMFIDPEFECVTISDVAKEIFRTQKFKDRYAWRQRFKEKIKPIRNSILKTNDFKLYFQVVSNQIKNGVVNKKTKRYFDLSQVDQRIVACARANDYLITTGDKDLIQYYLQQFSNNPDEIISPLGMVNIWINKGLISWDVNFQTILEDWNKCDEAPQPKSEIKKFEKLTDYKYLGT